MSSWYAIHQQQPDYLAHASPERVAIDNIKGVFKYVLEGRERATEYFQQLLAITKKQSINTLANLQWLAGDVTGEYKQ